MRVSTRLFIISAMLIALGGGLFTWGATTDLTPAPGFSGADVMGRIGQVAGAVGGVGVVVLLAALVMRLRGR